MDSEGCPFFFCAPVITSRAAIIALLTALNLINYIDRFLVMAVGPRFQKEFDLSDGALGVVETAFMLGYMITSPIFGALGDRLPRKGLITTGVVLWSVATVASGLTTGFWSMFWARVAVGVGEASYATLSPTIIDDLVEPEKKNRYLAIFYTATPVGAALGYVLGGLLEPRFGWRNAFFIAGGPGVILALAVLLIREPRRTSKAEIGSMSTFFALFRDRSYRFAALGYVAQTFALGGFTSWAAPFLSRKLCMELATGNKIFGAVTVVTGLAGTAIGGVIADRVPGDRVRASLRVCAWSSAIAAPLALAAIAMPTPTGFIIGLALAELAIFASVSPTNAAILLSAPPAARASAMALSIFLIHLLGDLISPPLIGVIADAYKDAKEICTGGRGLTAGMYLLPAALVVSALVWRRGARVTRPGTA